MGKRKPIAFHNKSVSRQCSSFLTEIVHTTHHITPHLYINNRKSKSLSILMYTCNKYENVTRAMQVYVISKCICTKRMQRVNKTRLPTSTLLRINAFSAKRNRLVISAQVEQMIYVMYLYMCDAHSIYFYTYEKQREEVKAGAVVDVCLALLTCARL